ncbi:MAG TPA: sugar transferase [Terriglobales bacterium]|nr:sugar transferase [Terriglobales bacterium]
MTQLVSDLSNSNPYVRVPTKNGTESREGVVNVRSSKLDAGLLMVRPNTELDRSVLDEESFHRTISLERKRTERSRKPFLLMLLDLGHCLPSDKDGKILGKVMAALSLSTRETDVTGWYAGNSVVGVMFTEIAIDSKGSILSTMMTRVSETLRSNLSLDQFNRISISFHLFPEDWDHDIPERPSNPTLYPDLSRRDKSKKLYCVLKRFMDVAGSLLALILFAPVFLLIAAAIKLTSKGPVFFEQKRVGQYGKSFVFLKFRSMHVNNDASVHKEYVRQLIAGQAEAKATGNGETVFKMTNDPRITKVGGFLRRTSLDELPQFINVLRGEMSLVGPRPAIAYEVEAYDIWHRNRVLEAKPGITGLWQVTGRSKVTFDEMVRLDLRYAKSWSPWMDLVILLRTPGAVVFGEGAH